jgi:hypothetical protein
MVFNYDTLLNMLRPHAEIRFFSSKQLLGRRLDPSDLTI